MIRLCGGEVGVAGEEGAFEGGFVGGFEGGEVGGEEGVNAAGDVVVAEGRVEALAGAELPVPFFQRGACPLQRHPEKCPVAPVKLQCYGVEEVVLVHGGVAADV